MKCKTCSGPTEGYKCDKCGMEAARHVEAHKCGSKHCMPKCAGCGQAEVLCRC